MKVFQKIRDAHDFDQVLILIHVIQLRHKAPAVRMNQANDSDFRVLNVDRWRVADGMKTDKQQSNGEQIDSLHGTEHPLV